MPNRKYQRGRAWEQAIVRFLKADDYDAARTAGSKGLWDVTASTPPTTKAIGHVRLIQAKTGSATMTKAARARLRQYTGLALVTAELWHPPATRGQPPRIEILLPEGYETT